MTILAILVLTVAAVSAVHLYFFRRERLHLVDAQIERIAAVLIASDFSYRPVEDPEETDDHLSDLLGRTAIDLVVLLREKDGKVAYENDNAELLKTSLSTQERWQFLEVDHHAVRVLTLPLAKGQRVLQVGLVLNQNLLRWKLMGERTMIYAGAILLAVLVISLFLRRMLLRPLDALAGYLFELTRRLAPDPVPLELPTPPAEFRSLRRNDEFGRLVHAVSGLAESVRHHQGRTRLWTAQMVHELKTPLTVLRSQLERGGGAGSESSRQALAEADALVRLVDEFLEWSFSLDEAAGPRIHAVRLLPFVRELAESLAPLHPGRLRLDLEGECTVFAQPSHLTQLLRNLLINALNYSPADKPVEIRVRDGEVEIRDQGPGIPASVLARRGVPFNRGPQAPGRRGTGLGLAWVTTISARYGWPLKFESDAHGTRVRLDLSWDA